MKVFAIIIAIIVIAAVVWLVVENSGKDTTNTNTATNTETSTTTDATNSLPYAKIINTNPTGSGIMVTITSSGFDPQTARIQVGDAITWYNNDVVNHYVAPDDHPDHLQYSGVWDDDGTGNIVAGGGYMATFTEAGTYEYHDHLNPTLTGTVIVE